MNAREEFCTHVTLDKQPGAVEKCILGAGVGTVKRKICNLLRLTREATDK